MVVVGRLGWLTWYVVGWSSDYAIKPHMIARNMIAGPIGAVEHRQVPPLKRSSVLLAGVLPGLRP